MAYCRFGEDSDLYIYKTQFRILGCFKDVWMIHLEAKEVEEFYEVYSLEDLLKLLLDFKKLKFKIPEHTFGRIYRELDDTSL